MSTAQPKALVVEDQPELRDAIVDELASMGFEVANAENGDAALKALETFAADIIFSDIRMPVLDGIELLKRLRAKNSFHPIIVMMSGFADVTVAEILDLGAQAYIGKPISLELIARIQRRFFLKQSEPVITAPTSLQSVVEVDLGKKLWLGNGGLTLLVENQNPRNLIKGTPVKVRLELKEQKHFEGVGQIVWNQQLEDKKAVIGIEWD